MRLTIFALLGAFDFGTSTPVKQNRVFRKSFTSFVQNLVQGEESAVAGGESSVAAVAASLKRDWTDPSTGGFNPNGTTGNAAIWQEAVSLDAAAAAAGNRPATSNKDAYLQIQYFQSQENSSNNGVPDGPETWAAVLQGGQVYPARFFQAQADDPTKSIIGISRVPQQTIKSFGASGAWWPNFLNDFPPAQQQNLSQLLFSEDWLYLSGYRYNMGASGDKDSKQVNTPGRGVESFMRTDGTYDWTRDGPGMYYVRAAATAGASIAFFINAAPSALTEAKVPCGGTLNASSMTGPFVQYIETVLAFWSDHNIKIDYISPMNEPDNDFHLCNQEGMAVSVSDRSGVFQSVRTALQQSTSAVAKTIKIMGDETSQIASQAIRQYNGWLPQTLQSSSIDAISAHMYDWPDDATLANYAVLIKNLSAPNPPPAIKMTEISTFKTTDDQHKPWGWTGPNIMKGTQWDPSIDSALDMARYIWQWLTLVNAESWDFWTAVSNMMPCSPAVNTTCGTAFSTAGGYNDALLYIDPNYAATKNYQFYLTKRFWVFRHFTKFIRPGSVRYDIPNEVLPYGTVAVASLGPDGAWNTIFINRNATAQDIIMKMPGRGGKILGVTQTTAQQDWGNVPAPSVARDDTVKLRLPARGVLSMQFSVEGRATARDVDEGWAREGESKSASTSEGIR